MTTSGFDPDLVGLFSSGANGVLATLRRDGRPQLSTVTYVVDHLDDGGLALRVSTRDGLAKTANLRRDPRAALHQGVGGGWSYAVAEGTVTISAPAAAPDDDVVDALVDLYRDAQGEHPDWEEYRQVMVDDRRVVVTLAVDRVYGLAR